MDSDRLHSLVDAFVSRVRNKWTWKLAVIWVGYWLLSKIVDQFTGDWVQRNVTDKIVGALQWVSSLPVGWVLLAILLWLGVLATAAWWETSPAVAARRAARVPPLSEAEIKRRVENEVHAEREIFRLQLAQEKIRLDGIMEVLRVKELWQWDEMNCCEHLVELLRENGKIRIAAGDQITGEWFEVANALLGSSTKLYNLLDKPNESAVATVYGAFWETMRLYVRGACLVNRARVRDDIDARLNRDDEGKRLDGWLTEHVRIAHVNHLLRGRNDKPMQSMVIPTDANQIRFEHDKYMMIASQVPNNADALERAREHERQTAGVTAQSSASSMPSTPRNGEQTSTGRAS
jgi:hypothetical protein